MYLQEFRDFRETVLNTLDKRLTNVSMSNLLGVISNS